MTRKQKHVVYIRAQDGLVFTV